MSAETTAWPFDADQHDPLTALRIPVTCWKPGWRYLACFDRESAERPTDQETAMLASYIHHYIDYWYGASFKAKLAQRQLDVDGGCNTVIFRKYAENDWGYRRDSWESGPLFVPTSPLMGNRELLDSFVVTHWKADIPETPQFEDTEAVGSNASESLLVARLRDRVMNLRRSS